MYTISHWEDTGWFLKVVPIAQFCHRNSLSLHAEGKYPLVPGRDDGDWHYTPRRRLTLQVKFLAGFTKAGSSALHSWLQNTHMSQIPRLGRDNGDWPAGRRPPAGDWLVSPKQDHALLFILGWKTLTWARASPYGPRFLERKLQGPQAPIIPTNLPIILMKISEEFHKNRTRSQWQAKQTAWSQAQQA